MQYNGGLFSFGAIMSRTDIKVRGFHLDIYSHVNNARYLEFLEEGRWAFFEEQDVTKLVHERGLAFVLVNININYRRPAHNGETLSIFTRISALGNKSCKVTQEIYLKDTDTLIADAVISFCLMDLKTNQAMQMDADIRAQLAALVQA